MSIAQLPLEIIEEILIHSDPLDVARVSQCSSIFRSLVYGRKDQSLWRALYLSQPFDDPRRCISQNGEPRTATDWKGALQRLIRARTVLYDSSLCRPNERIPILKTLLEFVSYIPPLSSPDNVADVSHNLLWVAAVLRGGAFLDCANSMASAEEAQLAARLHTYLGLTHADARPATRVKSRAFVYDMRHYRWDNEFGPFDGRGCVDWVHVQALHHTVSMHIVDLQEDEDFEFAIFPMSLPFTQIVIPSGIELDKEEDWAGVAGSWWVSFCFCDHRELLRYNDSAVSDSGSLDVTLFEEDDFYEVFRTLDVDLRVTRTLQDPNHPTRPIICFTGEMPDTTSGMTGQVKMTPDNQVHWHFVSGDQGNAIWSSQGVQIGGLRASFGVLGSWTTAFHHEGDPVGPFWLRKQTSAMPLGRSSMNVH